ncbi:hypothetical protein AS593_07535 [Caulobacter vibrioides]|nr:hypothetical protein AS593_07535 [Caulobacter vibrioides]
MKILPGLATTPHETRAPAARPASSTAFKTMLGAPDGRDAAEQAGRFDEFGMFGRGGQRQEATARQGLARQADASADSPPNAPAPPAPLRQAPRTVAASMLLAAPRAPRHAQQTAAATPAARTGAANAAAGGEIDAPARSAGAFAGDESLEAAGGAARQPLPPPPRRSLGLDATLIEDGAGLRVAVSGGDETDADHLAEISESVLRESGLSLTELTLNGVAAPSSRQDGIKRWL